MAIDFTSSPPRPRFAVNAYSTPHNTVFEDIEQTALIGGAAVGLWEGKFADDDDEKIFNSLATSSLDATIM